MSTKRTIAIDGHSGCGKSTLAKAVAKTLGYLYVDSGSMYRAITWFLLKEKVNISNEAEVALAIKDLNISFVKAEEGNHVAVNGEDVEKYIRTMEVSSHVSPVAILKTVRDKLVTLQQETAKKRSVVMDGRDIGTVVFKNADLKVFLTADVDTRVARRVKELLELGKPASVEEVKKNLEERDYIDSNRAISPLRKATDAIVIDNSTMTKREQLEKVLELLDMV